MVTSAGHPSPKLHSNKETPNSLFPASSASAGSSHSHEIRNDLWVIVTYPRTTPEPWGLRNGVYNTCDALGCIVNKMVYCQASSIPNPAKNNELFKKWAAFLKVKKFLKSTYKFSYSDVICSEHFTEDDYRVPGGPITRRFGIVLHFVAKPQMFCNDDDSRMLAAIPRIVISQFSFLTS